MDKYITMSQKEIKRYDIIKKLLNKEINGTEASKILKVSTRQVRRMKAKVKDKGIKGLIHASRGKISSKKIADKKRSKIVELIKKNYYDFGPLLATEKLNEIHNIEISKSATRTIMIEEGIWKPRSKKAEKHRSWRQRKANYGEMIQYDGSYAYWFEDRGEKSCLLASIDDAKSEAYLKFDEHEGVKPTFNFWREYIEEKGKPFSIYVDRFSTYSMNSKLAKENPDTLTQFERAMENDLNIEVIHAKSAQGKGRVENLFKTLQDRLIKELRLQNISTVEKANKFLKEVFTPKFNDKFMVEPRSKANLHKQLTKGEIKKLDSIFSRQYERVVRNDFTISHKKKYYQLLKQQPVTICKRDKVTIEERMDDTIHLRLRGKYLNYEVLPDKPRKLSAKENKLNWVIAKSKAHTPSKDHPWKQQADLIYLKKLNKMSK